MIVRLLIRKDFETFIETVKNILFEMCLIQLSLDIMLVGWFELLRKWKADNETHHAIIPGEVAISPNGWWFKNNYLFIWISFSGHKIW